MKRRSVRGTFLKAIALLLAVAAGTTVLSDATRVLRVPLVNLGAVQKRLEDAYPADSFSLGVGTGSGIRGVNLRITAWNSPLGLLSEKERAEGARRIARHAWRLYERRDSVDGVVVTFLQFGSLGGIRVEKELAVHPFSAAELGDK